MNYRHRTWLTDVVGVLLKQSYIMSMEKSKIQTSRKEVEYKIANEKSLPQQMTGSKLF